MSTMTRSRRSAVTQYAAVGVPPAMLDELREQLEAEDAVVVKIEDDEEGCARVCFHLSPCDRGHWLAALSQRFGCGLVPVPKC